jgi:hypothetical protein
MLKKIIFIALFCVSVPLFAQKQITTQSHAWVMYFGNHKISERWGIHTEYQWRRNDFFQNWQQSLLRLGVDYYSKQGAQYTAGYGWIRSYVYGNQPIAHFTNEHRIWEQLILKNKVGRVDFNHRYRLEQRFIENWETNTSGDFQREGFVFRQRVRYRFMATIPISRKEMKDNTLFFAAYDEPFLGFGKGIGKNILDQNRLYLALGWKFNKNVNVQLGYLNQYIVKTDGVRSERNHTLQVGFTYNLDFSKQE